MTKKILVTQEEPFSMQADGSGAVVTNADNPMNHVTVSL